ncbi:hypothetical protein MKW98_002516 [Papaver atlanticum]|uniref:Uncharacterized protein n=1 Tax=Papaver atlanticum TaxID=357466 RepID=A0AAD4XCE6_9MAGN|nr:hypothetical protein MKW98_002516 [Papaver atlanticum]
MALRRVATHVSQMLLEGREGVGNYFADPVVVKVQTFLKYKAEIVKEGDLARQKLERLKAEFMRLQERSAECKAKHGAAEKFTAVIVGSFVAILEQRRGQLADH